MLHGRVAISTSAHSSRDFETELRELQQHLLAMGARCERVVGLAFDGYLRGDPATIVEVEELDARIDRDEIEIHSLILRILALRQPVADDLRFLAMALRLIIDLERIGAEAVNITERTVKQDGEVKTRVGGDLASMAAAGRDMLHEALDAFVRWDAEAAERVLGRDDVVDKACAAVIGAMTSDMTQNASDVQAGLRVIRVAKYLERIADHATNVAEQVIFMVRGDDVRHGQWRR
jgi:phosphate transport system protein